jgi:hypothetical protein
MNTYLIYVSFAQEPIEVMADTFVFNEGMLLFYQEGHGEPLAVFDATSWYCVRESA